MSDDSALNAIESGGRARSTVKGDVPDHLRRRYCLDGRGGLALGFYADARIKTPAFRDQGGRLTAARSDPNVIRDMTAIARHRGWTAIVVRGDHDFRREAWLAARAFDIAVVGYRPSARDQQDLERRQAERARRLERDIHRPVDRSGRDAGPTATLRTVETVVRARVSDPAAQGRIIAAARLRIADWLEHGSSRGRDADARRDPGPERQRSR
jgi:hypothetical protein